ncbi:MAG: type II toxin-antitoxin system Phd/YefM family antitoxin [Deltaproteobacteria bacterium]|nr:type II toxin-antitoxin system Phd/YefM family antitoxin [Deltaproteobacteria bacterium]
MRTYTANEAETHFGEILELAQQEPVGVKRQNKVVGVMVSAQDYAAMRAFYADRLLHSLDEANDTASKLGLTPKALEALLADES